MWRTRLANFLPKSLTSSAFQKKAALLRKAAPAPPTQAMHIVRSLRFSRLSANFPSQLDALAGGGDRSAGYTGSTRSVGLRHSVNRRIREGPGIMAELGRKIFIVRSHRQEPTLGIKKDDSECLVKGFARSVQPVRDGPQVRFSVRPSEDDQNVLALVDGKTPRTRQGVRPQGGLTGCVGGPARMSPIA